MQQAGRERQPAGPAVERDRRAAAATHATRSSEGMVLQLQRAAGNRAVAGWVAPPQLPAQKVQRQALTPDDILKAVESSKFLKQKLEGSTSAQKRVPSGHTGKRERMRKRVEAILANYERMFGGSDAGGDNAMMLALAVDAAAKVIADELYDPGLKAKINEVLFEVYGPKIQASLAKKRGLGTAGAGQALDLAKVLGSGDPVSLYMHEEMRLEHAAHEIARMAHSAKVEPKAMFATLSARYQAELASYTLGDVKKREHEGSEGAKGSYQVGEATGELSADFFKTLFGNLKDTDRPLERSKAEGGGLKFTKDAADKLDKLRDAVEHDRGKPLPATAAERLKQHFDDVTARDAAIAPGRKGRVKSWLMKPLDQMGWGLGSGTADNVITKLEQGLPGLPLTLTVSGEGWFPTAAGPKSTTYGAVTGFKSPEQELAKLIGVKGTKTKKMYGSQALEYRGKYEHAKYGQERGKDYLRFRHWKDQLMTGNLGFTPEELPKFGAVNVHWATTRGTEGESDAAKDIGVNYYGDTHFLLDKSKVKDRVIYTATDHGQPHRDPFLAFADFLLGPKDDEVYDGKRYRSDITRLKGGRVGGAKSGAVVAMDVINAILDPTNAPLVKRGLPFELQVFGEVKIDRDVSEIHVSPAAPPSVFTNASAWAKANAGHVGVYKIDVPADSRVPIDAKFGDVEAPAKAAAAKA